MTDSSQAFQNIEKPGVLFNKSPIPFKKNRTLQIIIVVLVILWGLTAIRPADWTFYLLENIPVLLFILLLAFLYKRIWLSNFSYLSISLLVILNAYGAHYDYTNTPIDGWIRNLFGVKGEYYDQIVHFSFGLLMAFPLKEFLTRFIKLRTFWLYLFIFSLLMAMSATFEITEMLVNIITNPHNPEKHMRLEHDPFNTHKDMTMVLVGSLISIIIMIVTGGRRKGK
ncbi:DUF2238 domain-containing protein [Pseudalkalibacillus caeni]|nr:DUF2238 domain-containing protein [Pseudalkalibacillus caeni]